MVILCFLFGYVLCGVDFEVFNIIEFELILDKIIYRRRIEIGE